MGQVERWHCHLDDTTIAMLRHTLLPNEFWDFTVLTAWYLYNQNLTPFLTKKSPIEVLFDRKLEYHRLRVFDCRCYLYSDFSLNKTLYRGIVDNDKINTNLQYQFGGRVFDEDIYNLTHPDNLTSTSVKISTLSTSVVSCPLVVAQSDVPTQCDKDAEPDPGIRSTRPAGDPQLNVDTSPELVGLTSLTNEFHRLQRKTRKKIMVMMVVS